MYLTVHDLLLTFQTDFFFVFSMSMKIIRLDRISKLLRKGHPNVIFVNFCFLINCCWCTETEKSFYLPIGTPSFPKIASQSCKLISNADLSGRPAFLNRRKYGHNTLIGFPILMDCFSSSIISSMSLPVKQWIQIKILKVGVLPIYR